MSVDACGTGACETCVLGCAPAPASPRGPDEAATVAASGVAVTVLGLVLAVTGTAAAAVAGALAAAAGGVLAGLGAVALRRSDRRDRALVAGVRLVPWATGTLVGALLLRVAAFLLA